MSEAPLDGPTPSNSPMVSEERAILTFNYVDYQRLGDAWFNANLPHAGILISYRQYARRQIGELARVTTALLNQVSAEDLSNTVRVLDEFTDVP